MAVHGNAYAPMKFHQSDKIL